MLQKPTFQKFRKALPIAWDAAHKLALEAPGTPSQLVKFEYKVQMRFSATSHRHILYVVHLVTHSQRLDSELMYCLYVCRNVSNLLPRW